MQVKKDQKAKETAERLPVTATDVNGKLSRKEPAGEATMHVEEDKSKTCGLSAEGQFKQRARRICCGLRLD